MGPGKSSSAKKVDSRESSLSPPPTKRQKTVSTTTQKAVSNFFTPVSKRELEPMTWRVVSGSLLVGKFQPTMASEAVRNGIRRQKIAIFDFDSTLVAPRGPNKFAKDAADWKWWAPAVPETLKQLKKEGYLITIMSNQGGINLDPKSLKIQQKRLSDFKHKVLIILSHLELPISIYAATARDHFRKPRTGMWHEFLKDHNLTHEAVDLEGSFFVGDAGGRQATAQIGSGKDHACSDRDFASNVGIAFHTPEEYFLNEAPQPFIRPFDPSKYIVQDTLAESESASDIFTKTNEVDVVLFCGCPGAGKSTFYWKHLEPLGYARVNQDILKSREKCLEVASELLDEGKSVAVDNTNADPETRAHWTDLAKKHSVPIRCVLFTANMMLCEHNDTVRALSSKGREADANLNPENRALLPRTAFTGFVSRFREPTLKEGFQDVTKIDFKFQGSEEQQAIWSKFWV